MKIKVNISISLKITLLVIIVSAIVIIANLLFSVGIEEQDPNNPIYESQYDKSDVLIYGINLSVSNDLNNSIYLNQVINDFIDWNDEVLHININLLNSEGELIISGSNDEDLVGENTFSYIVEGNDYSKKCHEEDNTYYIPFPDENPPSMIILSPINKSGEIVGTYECKVSMAKAYEYIQSNAEENMRNSVLLSAVILIVLIFVFLSILRKIIVKPIITFRDKAKIIGKGNLDTKIEITSKDELGELANAFNEMAKDLKESRDKIQDYNQILENLLQQKDEFIGQLGHDLKNPLQPLVGLLPMLIEKEKDPSTKEALQVMNKNVEYMRDLIFDTLELAKLRSSNIEFNKVDLNLREEAGSVIESQKLLFKGHNTIVENNIGNELFVNADKLRLSEVLKNLITNSVKYTPEKGGKITIDAKQVKDEVTITISDNGIGMDKEQLKKVFDEFYKADKFSSDYYSTGLGLSICKRIIDKHGGKIWVESPGPGKGSTFYFTLKSGKFKNNEK